uniref:Putative transposase n=1 Tax=Anopheles braziliensis TaxID=58242 RepID=A0A2M3ZBR0_9DIPT
MRRWCHSVLSLLWRFVSSSTRHRHHHRVPHRFPDPHHRLPPLPRPLLPHPRHHRPRRRLPPRHLPPLPPRHPHRRHRCLRQRRHRRRHRRHHRHRLPRPGWRHSLMQLVDGHHRHYHRGDRSLAMTMRRPWSMISLPPQQQLFRTKRRSTPSAAGAEKP